MGCLTLREPDPEKPAGMRGYITRSSSIRHDTEPYDLEIGQAANCDPEMAAVAAMTDEILEFLRTSDSYVAKLLLDEIKRIWSQAL